jgi:hypothetical protein
MDEPLYVPNMVIRRDLQTPTVKEEIRCYSSQYCARLSAHPNDLIVNLMELPDNRRKQRYLPNDLPTRFLVVIVVFVILVFKSHSQKPQEALSLLNYRGALLSTLLHATVYVSFTQFAECISTDCKWNGITKKKKSYLTHIYALCCYLF